MQFVRRTLQGKIKTPDVFMGLVQAIVTKDDKIARGKGMQGFRYPPAWQEFCQLVFISSPRAYHVIKKSGLPVVGERELR
jgi:hypothetical protein